MSKLRTVINLGMLKTLPSVIIVRYEWQIVSVSDSIFVVAAENITEIISKNAAESDNKKSWIKIRVHSGYVDLTETLLNTFWIQNSLSGKTFLFLF